MSDLDTEDTQPLGQWLKDKISRWRAVLSWLVLILVVMFFSTVAAWYFAPSDTAHEAQTVLALAVTINLTIYMLSLIFFFFYVFRGAEATKQRIEYLITYCYAFIIFALAVSILPFVVLHRVPSAIAIMEEAPFGVIKGGCIAQAKDAKEGSIPDELRCGVQSEQWVVNIGGIVVPAAPPVRNQNMASAVHPPLDESLGPMRLDGEAYRIWLAPGAPVPVSLAAAGPGFTAEPPARAPATVPSPIQGGLVVPLYVVVLALMGATVSMTRRVPEFQRRMTPGDPEFMTFDTAREAMVFQIMQVVSAPLIAIATYYVVDPNSRASTIVLAFASGFSSETILLLIRAALEKLRPNVHPADPVRSTHVSASPERLDFGDVVVGTSSTKTVSIRNPTTIELMVTSTNCTGEFTTPPAFTQRVPAGSSTPVTVIFAPQSEGDKIGVLTISDNGVGSPRSIALNGRAIKGSNPNPAPVPPPAPQGGGNPAPAPGGAPATTGGQATAPESAATDDPPAGATNNQ